MIATEFYWEYHLCEGSYCPGREPHGFKSWILEEPTYPSHAEFVVVLLAKNTHTPKRISIKTSPQSKYDALEAEPLYVLQS